MGWTSLIGLLGAGFLLWYAYGVVTSRPELFTLNHFNKSLRTLLYLAFILLAFVAFCVFLLRASG